MLRSFLYFSILRHFGDQGLRLETTTTTTNKKCNDKSNCQGNNNNDNNNNNNKNNNDDDDDDDEGPLRMICLRITSPAISTSYNGEIFRYFMLF